MQASYPTFAEGSGPATTTGSYDQSIKSRITRYMELGSQLKADRTSWEAHWRDLADYLVPRRFRINPNEKNRGDKRNQNIVDSSPRFAVRTLQSGLHAGLTSPARPWMKLTTHNQGQSELPSVRSWLHIVTNRMLQMFLQTNVYNVLPIVYGDMGVFATGAMAVLPDERDLFRCYQFPIGSYWLGQDHRGVTTTFMREYELTVRQVVEQFALQADRSIDRSVLSSQVLNAWDRGRYEEKVSVTWMVTPNEEQDNRRFAARYLPFASCYWETDGKHDRFLDERGFKSFPVMAPRWDITGEDAYGTDSPGIIALGDVRQLQIAQRRKGSAIWKMIDPPIVAPTALRTQKTSMLAGDVTYVDIPAQSQGLRALHEVTLNLQHLAQDIYETQHRIERAFYVDLFLMLAQSDAQRGSQPITAREVEERHEEKLIALGPVLERTNDELLDPFIDRTFLMMLDAGLFPDPPPQLEGVNLRVEYISIMAQAQKLVGVVGHDRFFMSVTPFFQLFPSAMAKIDVNQAIDDYADQLGVDPRIIRPTEEAEAMVAEQQQAQQAQAQAEQMATMAAAGKDAAQAPMTGDTMLTRMASAMNAPTGVGGAMPGPQGP
jgi:Bacteriophage head to tail connecting protein